MREMIMQKPEEKIIFFEDNKNSRETIMDNLKSHVDSGLIISPNSNEEIPEIIDDLNYEKLTVITDFDLSFWVGNKSQNPIIIGKNEYHNGLEILEYFYKHNDNVNLYIYSANNDQLTRKLRNSEVYKIATIIGKEGKHGLNYISEFLEKKVSEVIEVNINVKPIHNNKSGTLSNNISYFFIKKLFSANPEDKIWKAGEYVWLVDFENDSFNEINELKTQKLEVTYFDNKVENYSLVRDYKEYFINEFCDNNKRYIKRDEIILSSIKQKNISKIYENLSLSEEYFVVKVLCEEFINKKINVKKIIKSLKSLSPIAQLESQKYLFINAQKLTQNTISSKEEIYVLLDEFHSNGFEKNS